MFDADPNETTAAQTDCTTMNEADDVTATVTPCAQSARETPTVTEFMSAVVPWPRTLQDPGWVCTLRWSIQSQSSAKPLLKGMGWPFHDIGDFVNRAGWLNGTTNFKTCGSVPRSSPSPHKQAR
jgi:hypothetical protein